MSSNTQTSETHVKLNQSPAYRDCIVNNYAERWREDDELPHIHDTPLFWVPVNGRPTRLSWNQMDDEQKASHVQAEQRAADLVLFNLCDWEGAY